ncbi:MAG: leucyl aminopeptidase family protein [Pseudomonadota bacterium]
MNKIFQFPNPFVKKSRKKTIPVFFIAQDDFKSWLKKQKKIWQTQLEQNGYNAKESQAYDIKNNKAETEAILCSISDPIHYLDGANAADFIQKNFSQEFLSQYFFTIESKHEHDDIVKLCIGWGLAHYKFETYKEDKSNTAQLSLPSTVAAEEVGSYVDSVSLIRNLINTPAIDLGTNELANAAKELAKTHKAKTEVIKGKELETGFPMIHCVGMASPRPPQLVDLKWGKAKNPRVTIVGKGIVYDTGGLNLKPGMYMRDMKKDMGGAAHALGLANMIMSQNLPVNLRVLLPIAENAVAGNSYRPGDVLQTRKGLTVEINDTDAEGRLVVADALTYACEEKSDLLIDFCTLTGAARVALGYDIPVFFSNNDNYIDDLKDKSVHADDPVWPLPLWQGYKKEMNSGIADMSNEGTGRAGAIHGALFLDAFTDQKTDWIHFDCYAWEQNGKPGRPKGGADTGMRAMFDFIKRKYG